MNLLKKTFAVFTLSFFLLNTLHAQNLTGTWRGTLGKNEYFEINIVQTGKKLCGYTWDYILNNDRNFCMQNFTSDYNPDSQTWFTYGTDFFAQSGGHILMNTKFKVIKQKNKLYMFGVCRGQGPISIGDDEPISAYRISTTPTQITSGMKSCIEEAKQSLKPVKKTPAPVKKVVPAKPKPVVPKKEIVTPAPVMEKPVIPVPSAPPPVAEKPQPKKEVLPATTAGRTNKESSHIIIHQRKLKLSVYDNGEVDGDTLSIYYNGRLIMSHKRLSQVPIVIDLELDANTTLHSFVLFAESLGTVPPNTALVIFNDEKGKRYELRTSSTFKENAQLVFEYRPD